MPDTDPKRKLLARRLAEARGVLLFERLWPVVVAVLAVMGLFLAVSWLGLWPMLPRWGRPVGVLAFLGGSIFIALMAARGRWPGRDDALARLDRDSGEPHRPVSAAHDVLADPHADPATRALWSAHRRRLDAVVARVRVRAPSPRLVDRDPRALRYAALMIALAAAFVAGPDRAGRVMAAFDWRLPGAPGLGFRLDSWIDPPVYTGRPPVVLSGAGSPAIPNPAAASGGASANAAAARVVSAPTGSAVVVRWSGDGKVEVSTEGQLAPAETPKGAEAQGSPGVASGADAATPAPSSRSATPAEPPAVERRFVLKGDGRLTVTRDGERVAGYDLRAIPDQPPTIVLDGPAIRNRKGSLTLRYKIGDDYGVIGAEAAFSNPVIGGKPVTGRSLVPPPSVPLSLPAAPRGLGPGETTADLADSPWAGATVTMVLSAKDEGGNTGRSAPDTVVLPQRSFNDPLARALVEQRRDLLLDPDHRERVGTALDALTLAPDVFAVPPPIYIGLRVAKTRLDAASDDPELVAVADLLWAIALKLEDGDLSDTERDLKALQQELKDALANHAPPEEIKRLTDALRQQLDKMLAEMARKAPSSAENDRRPDARTRTITGRQLQDMIDRMEQAARSGDVAEAQRLLDQLRGVLDNLKTAQRRSGGKNQAGQQMQKSLSDLDRMTRDQQALRDDTFQDGRQDPQGDQETGDGADQPGTDGMQPKSGDQDGSDGQPRQGRRKGSPKSAQGQTGDLEGRQGALRRKLQALQKQMRDMGLDGEKGLGEAEKAMKDAEGALGRGADGSDEAVEAQGRALRGLQQGAQGLQRQMAQQGKGQGDGQGDQSGEGEDQDDGGVGGQATGGRDPLGRPLGDKDLGLGQNGREVGPGLAARAQQVLEELRRRLGDPSRPQEEQDYLERLLKRY